MRVNRGTKRVWGYVLFWCTLVFTNRVGTTTALAQGTYTITQATTDATNHEWPSVNDSGVMVCSQQVANTSCAPCSSGWMGYPCTQGLCWQVFTSARGQVTFDTHNHVFTVIDNDDDIVYVEDGQGAGPGLAVVELFASGGQSTIEFSSGSPPGCTEPPWDPQRVPRGEVLVCTSGSATATDKIISYHDFCSPSCTRTFDVSGVGVVSGFPNTADYPDINAFGEIAYFDEASNNVYETAPLNPLMSFLVAPGSVSMPVPRINDQTLVSLVSPSSQVLTYFPLDYKANATVNAGLWADINKSGVVVFENTDTSGYHQVYQATPYCGPAPLKAQNELLTNRQPTFGARQPFRSSR